MSRRGKIFVLGATSPLGRGMIRRLEARGYEVIAAELVEAEGIEAEARASTEILALAPGDRQALAAQVAGCAGALNMTGLFQPATSEAAFLDRLLMGGRDLALACAEAGVPLLQGVTSAVYGSARGRLREDTPALFGPPAGSPAARGAVEQALEHLLVVRRPLGLRYVVARYFDVYGPAVEIGVVARFVQAVQAGAPLRLAGAGAAERSFCWIDDALRATAALFDALLAREAGVSGRAFNVGSEEPVSIEALARRLCAAAGRGGSCTEVLGEAPPNTFLRVPDTEALAEAVGVRARTSLDAGLAALLGSPKEAPALPDPEPRLGMVRPRFAPDPGLLATFDASLRSGWVSNGGPELRAFEAEAARYLGVDEVIAVTNGAMGLLVGALALDRRGKALLPAFTYTATASALALRGLEPVFCDVDPHTWTLDPAAVEAALAADPEISLVVPVNVFGVAPDLARLEAAASAHGATLLYDNAHGFGAEDRGRRLATEAPVQLLSLHATKILPAVEGGLLWSPDPALMAELRRLSVHGLGADLLDSSPGYNAKLDELRAAVGRHSLARFPAVLARRQEHAHRLRERMERGGIFTPQALPEAQRSNFQNLGARLPAGSLQAMIAALESRGVEGKRYFWPPLHQMRPWAGRASLPVTEALCEAQLCLPLYSDMRPRELARVEAALDAAAGLYSERAPASAAELG